jgi:hypothetical protein
LGFADRVRAPRIEEVPSPRLITGLDGANRTASIKAIKRLLLGIVRSILSGDIGTFEGCSAIVSVAFPLNEPELNEALRFFEIVAGETDDLPTGETRKLWAPEALEARDGNAADYERKIRSDFHDACRLLKHLLEAEIS